MFFALGIAALCAYLYFTQTARIAKETAAKETAEAQAAEQQAAQAQAAARPAEAAARATAGAARPGTALSSPAAAGAARSTPPVGATPAPKANDWMWQKATPEPHTRKR